MPRPWTLALAAASIAAVTASTLVIIHHDPVPRAGQIIGYVPSSKTPSKSPSATPSVSQPALTLADPQDRPLAVSIVGDALAVGEFASGPNHRNRNLILSALKRREAVTTAEAYPSGASTAVTVPSQLDLVVLELGTNNRLRASAATFADFYGSLVASVRKGSPSADLVCAGTWSANGGAYDAVIEQDCIRAGGRFISLRALYEVPSNRGPAGVAGYYGVSDDIAPNNAGHLAIARAVMAAVGITLP